MNIILKSIIITIIVALCYGERTKDKMYKQISATTPCFRRLNATHQTGCSSLRSGSTGVVHFILDKKDLHFILENGTAGPYIPVMPVTMFSLDVALLLKTSDLVSGLVVFKTDEARPDEYSHEAVCPNAGSGLENTCTKNWNPLGTGLLNEDFHFPIFYLTADEDVQKIKDCFDKFNNFSYDTQHVRSLCSLELNSFMLATTDTPTCIRRSNSVTNFNPVKFCDPLGDENIWASLFPVANTSTVKLQNKMKYIILSARLDSTSLFLDVVPGAVNPVTSIVALLTTARLLKQILPYNKYDQNVLFVLFNGETYDYIGSQRMLYDMEMNEFPTQFNQTAEFPVYPIRPEDIKFFVEFGQLGKREDVHIFRYKQDESSEFISKLKKLKTSIVFREEQMGIMPPSSLQTFLKSKHNISGLVLADHGFEFANKFYNSIYDNASNIDYEYYNDTTDVPNNSIQKYLANISAIVAKSIFEEITRNEYNGDINIEDSSLEIANELMNCYLVTPNCKIYKAIQKKKFKDEPYSFYVSVSVTHNLITYLTGLTLGWLTGEIIKDEPCEYGLKSHVFQYYNMSKELNDLNKTVCYQTTLNFTEAVSPAFIIEDYDWKSGVYSSWSESAWRDIHARLFLKPSAAHEHMTIAIGSLVLVFSVIVVYFIKTRSHILFAPPVAVSPTSC